MTLLRCILVSGALSSGACAELRDTASAGDAADVVVAPRASAPVVALGKPTLTIGGVTARQEDELNHKNGFLTGVEYDSLRFVVLDESKLRYFHASKQTAVVGRKGSGPGEFRTLATLCRVLADTLVAYDATLQRITVLTSEGELVRQFAVGTVGGLPRDGCIGDGTFLLYPIRRETGGLVRMNTAGSVVDTLFHSELPTLGRRVSFVANAGAVLIANSNELRIRRVAAPFVERPALRLSEQRTPLSVEDARALFPYQAAAGSKVKARGERVPERFWPLFEKALGDGAGGLWLQDVTSDGFAAEEWAWIDSQGTLRARLAIKNDANTLLSQAVQFVPGAVWILRRDRDGAAHFDRRPILRELKGATTRPWAG